jgi:hypothetical protein
MKIRPKFVLLLVIGLLGSIGITLFIPVAANAQNTEKQASLATSINNPSGRCIPGTQPPVCGPDPTSPTTSVAIQKKPSVPTSVVLTQPKKYISSLLISWAPSSNITFYEVEISRSKFLSYTSRESGTTMYWQTDYVRVPAPQSSLVITPKYSFEFHLKVKVGVKACTEIAHVGSCSSTVYVEKTVDPPISEQIQVFKNLALNGTLSQISKMTQLKPLYFPYSDWTNDGCSKSPDQISVLGFKADWIKACILHDYLYRNANRLNKAKPGTWSEKNRKTFDDALQIVMREICGKSAQGASLTSCLGTVGLYYSTVRGLGNFQLSKVAKSILLCISPPVYRGVKCL